MSLEEQSVSEATRVTELERAECLDLIRHHGRVGRVAFVHDGRAVIFPVNYIAYQDGLVFVTAPGTKLSSLANGAPVTFEVDDSTAMEHAGWSVIVEGTASEVINDDELDVFRRGPLKSWAVSSSEHWIRVTIDSITGRRIPSS